MFYNSALDHSIAHHKSTCTRLLCTRCSSEYRESHTKEGGLPISATATASKKINQIKQTLCGT